MRKYKVRDGFTVHKDETAYQAGTILDLSESEAARYAVQVEEVEVKSQKSKVKSDLADEQVQS